ncbi:methylated-DNA--[protein]-cysteine S-methyltransferase [Beggiatoa leptomitoformis]|uniref:methylated-DNA--[protein]-cysteine S-methyltransferase n=1 Tax=Beggiatoa leptomitoformis TaxID=288004 RepID=A0A2N9YDC9_9GAMM|nr:methylated-DNA--[protein]-cysteine S-methyltransferase [Beggiatoa leptomitoformis]AUI68481.1 methylated-DNA--[protein]-cysteine S-methyltransferase [Beggiatoa leptomitoformis]QGX03847.1 methylated-DNA--[protein]-cysteine S-methyltransferase [Beggiatoa leptomitoformis]
MNIQLAPKTATFTIRYGKQPSPFGECVIGVTEQGVCYLAFTDSYTELQEYWTQATLCYDARATADLLPQIFKPNPNLDVCVQGTAFQQKVWTALTHLPFATVISYATLAETIGHPQSARAVGQAVAKNTVAFLIPCHRVIRQSGELGDYRWGVTRKQAMLAWEKDKIA